MTPRRVAVVGGGLSGLAAAAGLRSLGLTPTVFESGPEVGGVVRSMSRNGWVIDGGACVAAEPDPAVRALLDAAGVCTVRAAPVSSQRFLVHDGAPIPLPHTLAEFNASPLLTLAGRLRLVKERLIPARRDAPEESVDEFARRRFGDEVADRMFDPLVACTAAGDPRQLLARYVFPHTVGHEQRSGSGLQGNLRARMEARRRARGTPAGPWTCVGGMQQLARQLAASLGEVRTGTEVVELAACDGTIRLVTAGAATEAFDGVIVAVPPPAIGRIAMRVPEASRLEQVASMPQVSIVSVSLGFRRDQVSHPLDGSRLLIPSAERRQLLSVVFPSTMFAESAPADHVLLTAYLGGARTPAAIDWSHAELLRVVRSELDTLLGIAGAPAVEDISRWRDALPQAVAGHARRLAGADIVETTTGAIAFTGAWRDGLSISEVLLGGLRSAERLAVRRGWVVTPSPV